MYELYIKYVIDAVTGNTKDPGVSLLRRLKSNWHTLDIYMDQLVKFNNQTSVESLQRRALEVSAWAIQVNTNKWPRDDYKELIPLIIVWLGGYLRNFKLKNARSRSPCQMDVKSHILYEASSSRNPVQDERS